LISVAQREGFIDGEGCFYVNIIRNNKYKTGWRVQLFFKITLHRRDKVLLENIQIYFEGRGIISTKHGFDTIQYLVYSIEDLAVVIIHIDKYMLISSAAEKMCRLPSI